VAEPVGFREYVAARQASLLRGAWLLTGDWYAAEDLVQVALAKVWPRWEALQSGGDPDAYVRRVVVTSFLTWRRRRWHGETPTQALPDQPARADPLVGVELRDALTRLLPTLTSRERAVLVLRYYDDLTEVQTAAILGWSVGTVKSQNARALGKLRVVAPGFHLKAEDAHD